ncbi:Carbon-nitrogen hydrolase [Arthrobacter sp. yr096]|uniref:carbon-nitrogen hydrolase family protein n=1 Tax=Arthrobacter sp. yr096 TaxID=1761750 RepID=UPI0008AE7CF3|nr:nitrilase-related carbon-nitrogen hydrolase [Arthrobacter sp. yr096]SEJ21353.1 Carbon-nitrogen hydrolase [Arthrobacter sp. yr096]
MKRGVHSLPEEHRHRPTSLLAVLAQLEPVPRRIDENVHRVLSILEEHHEADLIVFPELFLTGYTSVDVWELQLSVHSQPIEVLQAACRGHQTALIVGFIEQAGLRPYNSMLMIDKDGTIAGVYQKTHLFGGEAEVFTPGDNLECVKLGAITVAPLTCFDIELPEPARKLANQGADLIISIAANMDPYYDDHELAGRARALDNRIPHIYVNRPGSEGPFDFVGGSRVIAANGKVLSQAGRGESVLSAELTCGARVEADVDYLSHLRPELY